jgi:uncharacterized SAM-binding protein YcdF (DUF218 family)
MSVWLATNVVAVLLMPPGCLIVLAAIGLLLVRRHARFAIALLASSWAALYVLSMPYVGTALLQSLEPAFRDPAAHAGGQAIVVLGGGRTRRAPEYGGKDVANADELVRLRYAAHLQRTLGKPILAAGGDPLHEGAPEALMMKDALEREFNVPVRWTETGSTTTDENARFTRRILEREGISRVYLVTNAWHLPRARIAFEHAGFTVIPAATAYHRHARRTALQFLPSAEALAESAVYFHEAIGLAWYRLKYFF